MEARPRWPIISSVTTSTSRGKNYDALYEAVNEPGGTRLVLLVIVGGEPDSAVGVRGPPQRVLPT